MAGDSGFGHPLRWGGEEKRPRLFRPSGHQDLNGGEKGGGDKSPGQALLLWRVATQTRSWTNFSLRFRAHSLPSPDGRRLSVDVLLCRDGSTGAGGLSAFAGAARFSHLPGTWGNPSRLVATAIFLVATFLGTRYLLAALTKAVAVGPGRSPSCCCGAWAASCGLT